MPDEVRRLGKLLRAFVWGQLAAGAAWAIATTWLAPHSAGFRLGVLAITAAISAATLLLEQRGRRTAAAVILVATLWIVLAARVLSTASVSHGSWFLLAVLVGEAGLFIGWRAAVAVCTISAALGASVLVLVERGVLVESPPPGPWLDWFAGVLMLAVIGILQVSAVRLYRGGLELANQASRRHRALFDGAPIALVELDLRDGRSVITDVNDAAIRLLGPQSAEGVTLPGQVTEPLLHALARGEHVVLEEVVVDLTGEQRRLSVRAELPRDPDELRHVIVSLGDVTEQRKLAEQVHDARRLETVASLAGSIAHDYNNLLTVSQMNIDRLARRVSGLADSRELERMRDANTRAATLTRQLLVFSRRDVAHRQIFDPDRVLANLEPLLRRTLDARIELVFALQSKGAVVAMDPSQLELLVTNLVYNAVDAMAQRGTLRIESNSTDDRVAIVVSDTGGGMLADVRDKAFEPFFTTRPGKRAGLGLTIVRSIVDESRGTIEVDTTPAGTRVEVRLPVTAPATPVAGARLASERILLVEDDDGIREVTRMTLEEAGYAVVAARNGNEALDVIASGSGVDLVVSDLVMPGLGGRELVDRLRSTHPTLPVLYISGHAADGPPVLDGKRVGFLAKPFTATQLLTSVRSVLTALL